MSLVSPKLEEVPSLAGVMMQLDSLCPHCLANITNSIVLICSTCYSAGMALALLHIQLVLLSCRLTRLIQPSAYFRLLMPPTVKKPPASRYYSTLHVFVCTYTKWSAFDTHQIQVTAFRNWDIIYVPATTSYGVLLWLKWAILIVPSRKRQRLPVLSIWIIWALILDYIFYVICWSFNYQNKYWTMQFRQWDLLTVENKKVLPSLYVFVTMKPILANHLTWSLWTMNSTVLKMSWEKLKTVFA